MPTVSFQSTRDVIIRTEDFAAAVQFYEHVLGFPVTMRRDHIVGFETGAIQLFVERGGPAHGPVFEMRAHDIAAAREHLVAAGCEVVEDNPTIPRCYMRDRYGVVFNLDRA